MAETKFENVNVRVIREPGAKTEVFVTSKPIAEGENPDKFPLVSANIYMPAGTEFEGGSYDLVLVQRAKVELPALQPLAVTPSPVPAKTEEKK